jgi:hypothetical protein
MGVWDTRGGWGLNIFLDIIVSVLLLLCVLIHQIGQGRGLLREGYRRLRLWIKEKWLYLLLITPFVGRYRITEGAEEIQMRKIAGHLFGYMGVKKAELSKLW